MSAPGVCDIRQATRARGLAKSVDRGPSVPLVFLVLAAALLVTGHQSWGAELGAGPVTALAATEESGKPLFELPSLDGPSRRLAEFRGRIVLLHFFATWCESCRPEMVQLQQLRARRADAPLEVVAVSVAEADGAVRRFFNGPPPISILLDRDRAVAKLWNIERLPTTIVLDFRLRPRFIAEGDVDWNRQDVTDALALLLKEVPRAEDVGGRQP